MSQRPMHKVSPDALRDFMERMLRALGCDEETSKLVANVHLEADLRGVLYQGLDHMLDLVIAIQEGHVDPKGTPEVVKESDTSALISGHRGPGHPAAVLGADLAIRKAGAMGCSTVGIKDSSDIYMLGYYGEKIARAGYVAFLATNCPPLVHAYGGTEPVVGTNPIVFAIPTDGDHPILFDMSTSARSASYFRQAAYHNEQVPEGVGLAADGSPSTDATTIDRAEGGRGAISPMAKHKGFGLGLTVSLLAGPLVGAATGKGLEGWVAGKTAVGGMGHFMMAVNPSTFGDPTEFKNGVSTHLTEIKNSRKAPGFSEIRIPGERTFTRREKSQREGVELLEFTWQRASELAAGLGVDMPE